jgi:hypothetical protein
MQKVKAETLLDPGPRSYIRGGTDRCPHCGGLKRKGKGFSYCKTCKNAYMKKWYKWHPPFRKRPLKEPV